MAGEKRYCVGCQHSLLGMLFDRGRHVVELSCACAECDQFELAGLVNPSMDQLRSATERASGCLWYEEAKEVG